MTAAFQLVIIVGVTVLVIRYGLLVTVVALGVVNVMSANPLDGCR